MIEAVVVREETAGDRPAVLAVVRSAFETEEEATLIERLTEEGAVLLSLVASIDNRICGHVLFSRMWIRNEEQRFPAVSLAPLAVEPGAQRRGLGAALVERGLAILRDRGESTVIVVGEPGYYQRFGFLARTAALLQSPFPPEYFMAMELSRSALKGIRGWVEYPEAFGL